MYCLFAEEELIFKLYFYICAEKQNLIEIRMWQRTPNLHHMLSAVKHYCYLNQNFFLPPSLMVSFYHDIQMAPPICCMWAKHIVPNRVLTHKISTKWEIFIFMARKILRIVFYEIPPFSLNLWGMILRSFLAKKIKISQ